MPLATSGHDTAVWAAGTTGRGTAAPAAANAAPSGCSREEVTALIQRFLAAFNQGDQVQLPGFFPSQAAREPRVYGRPGEEVVFRWYWVNRPGGRQGSLEFEGYKREDLARYFAERHALRERLMLQQLDYHGVAWLRDEAIAHIGIELIREADDLPSHIAVGKASIDCRRGTILLWSIGQAR